MPPCLHPLPLQIYSFLALASFYNKFFGLCSKAFIKLESLPSIPTDKQESYADLAMSIFLKNPPADPRSLREAAAAKKSGAPPGRNPVMEALLEDLGGTKEAVCVASGRLIRDAQHVRCKTCKHSCITAELRGKRTCPLCHALLPPPGASGGDRRGGAGASTGRDAGGGAPWGGYAPIGEDELY